MSSIFNPMFYFSLCCCDRRTVPVLHAGKSKRRFFAKNRGHINWQINFTSVHAHGKQRMSLMGSPYFPRIKWLRGVQLGLAAS